MAIKVASYNIRKAIGTDRQRRPERILSVLAELDADVVCLQEADRRIGSRLSAIPFDLIAHHSDYRPVPYEIRPGGLGWHGNAILIRRDADRLFDGAFDLILVHVRCLLMDMAYCANERLNRAAGSQWAGSPEWREKKCAL